MKDNTEKNVNNKKVANEYLAAFMLLPTGMYRKIRPVLLDEVGLPELPEISEKNRDKLEEAYKGWDITRVVILVGLGVGLKIAESNGAIENSIVSEALIVGGLLFGLAAILSTNDVK